MAPVGQRELLSLLESQKVMFRSESDEEELPPLLESVSRKKGYVSSYNPVPRGHDISKACSTYLQHVGKFKERKSGNAVMFVRQFEEALSMMPRINNQQKVFWFGTCLGGLALRWFNNQKLASPNVRYEQLIEEFLNEFRGTGTRVIDIVVQMTEARHHIDDGQTVQEYALVMQEMFNEYRLQSGRPLRESDKVTFFIDGLAPNIQEATMLHFEDEDGEGYGDATFKRVLKYAEKVERTQMRFESTLEDLGHRLGGTRINAVVINPKKEVPKKTVTAPKLNFNGPNLVGKTAENSLKSTRNQKVTPRRKIKEKPILLRTSWINTMRESPRLKKVWRKFEKI